MIHCPFQLPIPLEAGICLAGAVDLTWLIAFRASRGAATASEKFACIFRRPYDARFARLVAPLVWGALPGRLLSDDTNHGDRSAGQE